jgi:hypothetical protein
MSVDWLVDGYTCYKRSLRSRPKPLGKLAVVIKEFLFKKAFFECT